MTYAQFSRRRQRTYRFIGAILVGCLYACFSRQHHRHGRISLSGLYFMLKALVSRRRAPFWTTFRRFKTCKKCPVFYSPLRTCGSPLDRELRDLGCYCAMEVKASLPLATCWLKDSAPDSGWGWKN